MSNEIMIMYCFLKGLVALIVNNEFVNGRQKAQGPNRENYRVKYTGRFLKSWAFDIKITRKIANFYHYIRPLLS